MALYPPVINYSMPAFSIKDAQKNGVRIYFALSTLNSLNIIKSVHLTVKYQSNNTNALSFSKYNGKIKVCPIQEITSEEDPVRAATSERFYVVLENDDLKNGFETNVTYKIQLRFSQDPDMTEAPSAAYFSSNASLFSEWSTVCLIRGIVPPEINIIGLEDETVEITEQATIVYNSIYPDFMITYTPSVESVDETLKQWRVQLYDAEQEELLASQGWNTSTTYYATSDSSVTAFEAILPYEMSVNTSYVLVVETESKNGYTSQVIREFLTSSNISTTLNVSVSAEIVEEDGYAKITVAANEEDPDPVLTNIVLQRTSSKTNYTVWEDLMNKTFLDEVPNWNYYDLTVESGVYYKYRIQERDFMGRRTTPIPSTPMEPIMGEFDSAFLTERSGEKDECLQLKLRYDFQISSLTTNISESKVDTLGSKYPFIRRNGNMHYRTFSGSGLIASCMDSTEHLFADDEKVYKYSEVAQQYQEVTETVNKYVNTYDYTYEKNFRDLVIEFLYNSKPKLFRSLQEGNMLVKLMDVSLTPKTELGRLFYSFSATFVEIGEPSISNLDENDILTVGDYSKDVHAVELDKLISINNNGEPFSGGADVMDSIKEAYGVDSSLIEEGEMIINDFTIKDLKIEINSDPYIIDITDGEAVPATGGTSSDRDYLLGWLLYIDGDLLILPAPRNFFEVRGVNYGINTQIIPVKDTIMQITVSSDVSKVKKMPTYVSQKIINKKINGQLIGVFSATDDIYQKIKERYNCSYGTDFTVNLVKFNTAEIEARPGTEILLETSGSDSVEVLVVNRTGILYIDPHTDGTTAGQTITSLKLHNPANNASGVEAIINYCIQTEKNIY